MKPLAKITIVILENYRQVIMPEIFDGDLIVAQASATATDYKYKKYVDKSVVHVLLFLKTTLCVLFDLLRLIQTNTNQRWAHSGVQWYRIFACTWLHRVFLAITDPASRLFHYKRQPRLPFC